MIFGSGTAEGNVLSFGYVVFLTLFYFKRIVASRESSKRRLYSRWRRKCLYFSQKLKFQSKNTAKKFFF
jgi:hypothetical protein